MNGDKYRKTYKVCESMSKRMVIVKLWVMVTNIEK